MSRARLRTESHAPAVVAAALAPDNTDDIRTAVADGAVETTVERESAGGLRTTVDDYVVNLTVAERIVRTVDENSTDEHTDDTQS